MKWSIVQVDRKTKEKTQWGRILYSRKTDAQNVISALHTVFGHRYLYYCMQAGGAE